MNKLMVTMILLAAWAGAAMGDIVYLRDGSKVEGKAVRKGDKVTVTSSTKVSEFDAKDVVYIQEKAAEDTPTADSQPSSAPVVTVTSQPAGTVVEMDKLTMPESVIFSMMRTLQKTDPGSASFELRQQIEAWRGFAHDRKRKASGTWLTPKDFAHHREIFELTAKEAQDLFKKRPTGNKTKAEIREALAPAYAKLRTAAMSWADPLLREFLMGVVDLQAENYTSAQSLFRSCHDDQPLVPAFSQAGTLAYAFGDRGLDSLSMALSLVQLHPDNADTYWLLKKALDTVPGTELNGPLYKQGKDILAQYEAPKTPSGTDITKNLYWMLPSSAKDRSGWVQRENMLPEPPVDRLIFRQAVGVPVAENMLLADAATVADAYEVFICIDGKTVVPAFVKKVTAKGPVAPLAVLVPAGATFTPVACESTVSADTEATVYGLGMYQEMGAVIRANDTKVTVAGGMALTNKQLPGEPAGPVLSKSGSLLCFLSGKTDALQDGGGEAKIIDLESINALIRAAKSSTAVSSSSAGKVKRTAPAIQASGKTFVVVAISGERFEAK